MVKPPKISISRLSIYLRFLELYLRQEPDKPTIRSTELANFLAINPYQIRKDLSYFGKFGKQGIGYPVQELKDRIASILGLDRGWNLCICGLGNLGSALFAYKGFKEMHLKVVAAFDSDPAKSGRKIQGIRIYDPRQIPRVVRRLEIDIGIITVPSAFAQGIANSLISSGIHAILNFAPVKLNVPSYVALRNADLATELINLTHSLSSNPSQKFSG